LQRAARVLQVSPSKARAKSRERLLRTILFDSDHLQHERERPDMERKYMNSDTGQSRKPELTNLYGVVGGVTNMQSKQASVLRCKSQSQTRADPDESLSRHCTLMKTRYRKTAKNTCASRLGSVCGSRTKTMQKYETLNSLAVVIHKDTRNAVGNKGCVPLPQDLGGQPNSTLDGRKINSTLHG